VKWLNDGKLLPDGNEKTNKERLLGVLAEIWTRHLPNISYKRYRLGRLRQQQPLNAILKTFLNSSQN
jgi:hypothetical protein